VYISFQSPLRTCSRVDIEDALDELLAGRGFIAGSGGSLNGTEANIDLELSIEDPEEINDLLGKIAALLCGCDVPDDTEITVRTGASERHIPLYQCESFSNPPYETDNFHLTHASESSAVEPQTKEINLRPGDALFIPLSDATYSVSKVIRTDTSRSHPVLIGATSWYGTTPPQADNESLSKPLILSMVGAITPYRAWIQGDPPDSVCKVGRLPITQEEATVDPPVFKQWGPFISSLVAQWKWQTQG
jgi:hypothetical protein